MTSITPPPERPNSELNNDIKKSNSIIRNWIILEDTPSKAEFLIAYILYLYPEDSIHWLFAEDKGFNKPTYLNSRKGKNTLKQFAMPFSETNQIGTIKGDVNFYWCKNKQEVETTFNQVGLVGDNILLLDVDLNSLGGVDLSFLSKISKKFLYRSNQKSIITIMSRVVNFGMIKGEISAQEDKRILALGGRWVFNFSTLKEDCMDVIQESGKHWIKLFQKNEFTLDDFLDKMSKFSQHECHNWQEEIKLEYYIQKKRWDEKENMPIQLSYLIQLLDYDHKEFVKEFDLKNDKGYFKDGSPICNCLKVMGTDDADSYSFSLLGATFICWTAYRQLFKNGAGNQFFIQAIKNVSDDKIARRKFITLPQSLKTLQSTIKSLLKMMEAVYYSTVGGTIDFDNLKGVELNETGLSIRLNINPEKLQKSIADEYHKRCNYGKTIGGGTTAQKIVDYYIKSNFCDNLMMNKKSFLGNSYNLNIYARGDLNENGTIFKFGNHV